MKKVIRKGVFETNSSSAHAFAFINKNDKDFDRYEKKLSKVIGDFEKVKVVVSSCDRCLQDPIRLFINWLDGSLPDEKHLDWYECYDLACDILELGDYDKIVDALKKCDLITEDMIINSLDSDYKDVYGDEDPYLVFAKTDDGISSFVEYWQYRKQAIEFYKKSQKSVNSKELDELEMNAYRDDYCICEDLFFDGALVECNCEIEDLVDKIPCEYPTMDALMTALFNDELSIFCMEDYGKYSCWIRGYVFGKDVD